MVLRARIAWATAAFLALLATPRAQGTATLHGRVEVRVPPATEMRPNINDLGLSKPRATDRRRSVVYLETAPRAAFEPPRERRVSMAQEHETFVPHVLAITAGTTVDFPNGDPVFHNVFSLSRTRPFDLGRYAAGNSKSVLFNRPGIVRVFCDIHSHMSAYIVVFAHRFFALTDDEGRYRLDGIPPGTYTVSVWNEAVATESQSITVASGVSNIEVNFALSRAKAAR